MMADAEIAELMSVYLSLRLAVNSARKLQPQKVPNLFQNVNILGSPLVGQAKS